MSALGGITELLAHTFAWGGAYYISCYVQMLILACFSQTTN